MTRLLSLNTYNYRRGGSDAVFLEHDSLFREIGWETAVFTMHHPKNQPSPWDEFFVDELEFGSSYNAFEKARMASKVVYSFEARRKLAELLRRFRPDVAHAHCIYHHLSPSVFPLLKREGIPVVMTAHDLKLACPAYKMLHSGGICEDCKGGKVWKLVKHRCVHGSLPVSALVMVESAVHKLTGIYRKNVDRVIVPSQFFLQKLCEWGWSRHKLVYIPNYVDCDKYEPAYSPGKYFFYFGRLAPEKGLDTLIRAAGATGAELKIAGTGPMEAELQRLAVRQNGLVEFLGYRSGAELWDLVRNARAVVLPSEWYENAPKSVLEAYAIGKPVIGARIGGIPEMIVDGETGRLFESGNVDALARALAEFIRTADCELERIGRNARTYVTKTFSRERYLEMTLSLYRSIGVDCH